MGDGGQRLHLRRRPRRAPVVRRLAARPGPSPGSGTSSRRCTTPRRSTPASRTRRCSSPPTAAPTWTELSGLRKHDTGPQWQPGAGGMCLHTILQHPTDADRLYVAISAAGAFRTSDGGETWQPINKGLRSGEIPDQDSEVGHCVHRIDMHPSQPRRALHAEALGRHAQQGRRRHLAGGQRQPARPTSASRSRCTRTSPRPSTSCRSPATPTTSRPTASCASTAAAPAATSGRR